MNSKSLFRDALPHLVAYTFITQLILGYFILYGGLSFTFVPVDGDQQRTKNEHIGSLQASGAICNTADCGPGESDLKLTSSSKPDEAPLRRTRQTIDEQDQLILAGIADIAKEQEDSSKHQQETPEMKVKLNSGSKIAEGYCNPNKYDYIIAERLKDGSLSRPNITSDGRFTNPFPTWSAQSFANVMKFVLSSWATSDNRLPKEKDELDQALPMVKPNFRVDSSQRNTFRATWLGHATTLIQVEGFNILTDPIFSDRASFVQFMGPKRIRPPPCGVDSLPDVDVVVISHNHYDHLDTDTVQALNKRFGERCKWLVPLGLGSFLQSMSVKNYVELDWWQKSCVTATPNITQDSSETPATDSGRQLAIYLTPNQHWSRRGINDINKSLWGSYTIVSEKAGNFFFTGDTGYCSVFKEIGDVFSPIAGAAIPIGAYKPQWFMRPAHVNPEEAVQIHRDLRSKKSFAIHHATFLLSDEPYNEPANLLKQIMNDLKTNESLQETFEVLSHGETTSFP